MGLDIFGLHQLIRRKNRELKELGLELGRQQEKAQAMGDQISGLNQEIIKKNEKLRDYENSLKNAGLELRRQQDAYKEKTQTMKGQILGLNQEIVKKNQELRENVESICQLEGRIKRVAQEALEALHTPDAASAEEENRRHCLS